MKSKLPALKFTLVQKLIAGYAFMAFFTTAALIFSIMGLYSLHSTAREIARKDLVVINSTNKLRESLLAQERYAGKYAILKSPEFVELYNRREAEFLDTLQKLKRDKQGEEIEPLARLYQSYTTNAEQLFQGKTSDTLPLKTAAEKVLNAIDTFYTSKQSQLNSKLEAADEKESLTIRWTLILSFTGFTLAIFVAAFFIYNISTSIRRLKKATHRIAEGDFDYDPQIQAGDEIGDLAKDFTSMAARLKVLEQISLDASPLTRLPGNIVIERILNIRLQEKIPFAVCYADLDNLKAYNDHYGYVKASEVIRKAGEIINDAVKATAGDDAFVGHIGGDDFIMVVDQEEAATLCNEVINKFDAEIRNHYSPADLARGSIDAVDRYGVPRVFPIMTISIAVTICSQGEYDSAVEIAKAAGDIKDYVKGMPGSNFLINRRKTRR